MNDRGSRHDNTLSDMALDTSAIQKPVFFLFLGCLKAVPLRCVLKRYIPRQNDEKGEKTDSQNREGSVIIVLRKR